MSANAEVGFSGGDLIQGAIMIITLARELEDLKSYFLFVSCGMNLRKLLYGFLVGSFY